SASAHILKNMNKNETPEEIERAINLVKENKMRVFLYLTFGLPGETKETMNKTYHFIKKIQPDFVTFGIVVPAPDTPFYEYLKKRGCLLEKDLPLNDPNALPAFNYPHLSGEEILKFSRSSYRTFYLNPKFILRRITHLNSYTEFYMYIKNAIAILRRYIFEPPG
ncbi:MAG: radical SAM protein, partial [Thermodesulfobacteriota bacterium]|nr:radical SAM protein [Thermodesulfobacteriota bacterium]